MCAPAPYGRRAHMPPEHRTSFKNHLLAALPPEDVQRFFSELHPVSLPFKHVVYYAGAPLEHVYFVEDGLVSMLTSMANGSTIEVGMIGPEGMIGIGVVLGRSTAARQYLVQGAGTALRMTAA